MIYLEMYGRLGNQFFRYAAARAVQLKYYPNEELCINFSQINELNKEDKTFYNVLNDYKVPPYRVYENKGKVISNETNILQKILVTPYYLRYKFFKAEEMNEQLSFQKKFLPLLNWLGVYWFRTGYCNIKKSRFKNKFLSGNFESPEYFEDIRDVLLSEFVPKKPKIEKNSFLYDMIEKTNSVCLSVRRGDFETNAEINKLHGVCDREYFEEAIDAIKKTVDNPTFFMFSDDIEWVKENINTGCETYYEDGDDPVWEKLRLMSSCKNFIISNSSFSWWSQWLSTSEKKIVVSPSKWFNNDYKSPLIKETWIKIEV